MPESFGYPVSQPPVRPVIGPPSPRTISPFVGGFLTHARIRAPEDPASPLLSRFVNDHLRVMRD